jgi:tetratricopeptide (TPR) repeat protein
MTLGTLPALQQAQAPLITPKPSTRSTMSLFGLLRAPTRRASAPARRTQSRVTGPGRDLREQLTAAVVAQDYPQAVACLEQLQQLEPDAARWPHKCGDMWRLMQRPKEALLAYASAARLYAEQGQHNLAVAIAKTAATYTPNCRALLPQLDPSVQRIFETAGCAAPTVSAVVLDAVFPHRDVLARGAA